MYVYILICATDCNLEGVSLLEDVTIYTLAKELNMTPSMISRAFNPNGRISDEKRKKVLETAKEYNFSPNRFASRLSMKTVNIGILISSKFPENTEQMRIGIERAYKKSKDYKVKYEIIIMNPVEHSISDYKTVLDHFKSYDGIILTGMSSSKYTDMINALYEHNKNIAQVQAINKNANYLFGSKHNEDIASNLAADFLYQSLKKCKRKNIIAFTGSLESALHLSAKTGFENACKKAKLNLLECIDMQDDETYFEQIIPGVFRKYAGETDGIYMTSGFSAPLCRYLEESKIDIYFVAFDTYKNIKEYIRKGIISATISQNISQQMENAFEMLVKHIITGEKIPKTVYTDVQIVLKSNMHQFE